MRLIFNRYIHLVTHYPKTVLALIAAVAVILSLGLPNFKLDASADSLTLEHDKDLTYFRDVMKDYGSGDFLIVTYKPKQDLFSDAALDTLADLKQDLLDIEGVNSINSILDVPLLYSPKQSVSEIILKQRNLMSNGVDRELAKKEFLNSPIYKDLILGPDKQTTAMQLNLSVNSDAIDLVQQRDALRKKRAEEGLSEQEQQELARVAAEYKERRTEVEKRGHERVEEVRNVVAKYDDKAEIFVGGVTMITADMIRFIKNDLIVFGTAVILFMIAILAFIFRSLRFVVIPMLTCTLAVFMMLGFVSWLDWRLTVISSNFVALLLIISLAIVIHLVVRYREYEKEHEDWDQKQLVAATVKFMARPCLYTALTTIVAFASLVVSNIRPVIDFGWMMTIGLAVALVLAFLIMPAILVLLPKSKMADDKNKQVKVEQQPLTLVFSKIVEGNGRKVIISSVIIAGLSAFGISQLKVENKFIDYFHDSTEIYQGLSVIDKKLGGTIPLDIIISHKTSTTDEQETTTAGVNPYGGVENDPFANDENDDPFAENEEEDPFATTVEKPKNTFSQNYWLTVAGLKRVEDIHQYLEAQPEIGKVQSLAILYQVGKDLNGGLNDFELAVLQKSLSGKVEQVLISPFVTSKDNETRMTLRIHDTYPGLERRELVDRIHSHLIENEGYAPDQVHMTGLLVLYNNMLQSLFRSQIVTLGAVFLCISVMFLILFQSLKVAIIAITPNILAALTVLGGMGLLGLPLDMMTITIAAITVGIGVDDTIHYIHRFKEEIKVDGDYVAAMHRSHASIGKAMYYTSIIIVFGFSIMVLSEFIPTIYFGLLTGFAMFAALMGALLLLPKLILLVKPFPVSE